jgi:hypothetical protein
MNITNMKMKSRGFTDLQASQWERVRQRGRRRYVVLYGVIGWGLLIALLSSAIHALISGLDGAVRNLAFNLVMMPLFGILFGYWMWSYNEDKHRRWARSRKTTTG